MRDLAWPAPRTTHAARLGDPLVQRRPVRMIHLGPLVLVDLPVDVTVVLEQQERANEAKRTERALPQRGCSGREHVFVRYARARTEAGERLCAAREVASDLAL